MIVCAVGGSDWWGRHVPGSMQKVLWGANGQGEQRSPQG